MSREKFRSHRGGVLPLPEENIDTDQIVPARYLLRSRKDGYGDALFADLRHDGNGRARPDFVMNRSPFDQASILVAYGNFGCGSSREQAVWALQDGGIKVVLAPSFGDIFFNNAFQNGLLLVRSSFGEIDALIRTAQQDRTGLCLSVDLENQVVGYERHEFGFDIEPYKKQALMEGFSEIDATMQELEAIEAFERRRFSMAPWLANPTKSERKTLS